MPKSKEQLGDIQHQAKLEASKGETPTAGIFAGSDTAKAIHDGRQEGETIKAKADADAEALKEDEDK